MKFRQRIKYMIDQFLSIGTFSIVMMLFLITFISVLIIGYLSYKISGDGSNFFETWWLSFMQTLDAGNLSNVDGTFLYVFLMTMSSIVGIFITSLLISVLSNGFQQKLENMKKGTSLVIEKNHTLILGFNDNVPIIVSEIIVANENVHKPVIVILSDFEPSHVMDELKLSVRSFKNTKIVIRRGEIHLKHNLDMCAIEQARSVIIAEHDDVSIIKCLLGISQTDFMQESYQGHVVAIFESEHNMQVAKKMFGNRLEAIHLNAAMTRITAQTALQPGLSFVYKDLLDFEGDEFYLFDGKTLIGKTLYDTLNLFPNAILCGILRHEVPLINPDMKTIIEENDQLILISEDDDKAVIETFSQHHNPDQIVHKAHLSSRHQRSIQFIGFNPNLLSVIDVMHAYITQDSSLSFLVPDESDIDDLENHLKTCQVEYHIEKGNTYNSDVLEKLDLRNIDTIVIISNDLTDGERSDSETLLSIMHLKHILADLNKVIPIIIEITKVQNEQVIQYASVDDFIVSKVLSSKMLTQIAENRHLNAVFEDLLGEAGSEIYLKPVTDYVIIDEPVDFYTIVESAALKEEIALGYRLKKKSDNGGVVINPNKKDKVLFESGDCIIVFAED